MTPIWRLKIMKVFVNLIILIFLNFYLEENTIHLKNHSKDLKEDIKQLKTHYELEIKKKDSMIEEYKKEILLYKRLIENQGRENEVLRRELNQISYEGYKNPDSNISNPLILITNE